MNAATFWETRTDSQRIALAMRCEPAVDVEEIFREFALLPNRLKAVIYDSTEFRNQDDDPVEAMERVIGIDPPKGA